MRGKWPLTFLFKVNLEATTEQDEMSNLLASWKFRFIGIALLHYIYIQLLDLLD